MSMNIDKNSQSMTHALTALFYYKAALPFSLFVPQPYMISYTVLLISEKNEIIEIPQAMFKPTDKIIVHE